MRTRKRHYVTYKEIKWMRGLFKSKRAKTFGWCLFCSPRFTPPEWYDFTTNRNDVTCKTCQKKLLDKPQPSR